MELPNLTDCRMMADFLIPGVKFDDLPADKKVEVIKLVQAQDAIKALEAISADTQNIAEWFNNSKVYYP